MIGGAVLITGAGGFIGQALARRVQAERLVLCDRRLAGAPPGAELVEGDLGDPAVLAKALAASPNVVLHLASVPSAQSEREPELSRKVNLDASLALLDRLAARERPARLVYVSSIAALGSRFRGPVDDDTLPRPALTYGAHKLMVETAFADLRRCGRIRGVALRLPGIVARPPLAGGFGSAFWSDIFHAVTTGRPYACPAGPDATGWLMSLRRCVDNLIHAAATDEDGPVAAMTLPALVGRLGDLAEDIRKQTGGSTANISYQPDPLIMQNFGAYPALSTPAADALGLRHDGDLPALVANALAELAVTAH
jgi:nucleoside-diphosphate-sugar epimerase